MLLIILCSFLSLCVLCVLLCSAANTEITSMLGLGSTGGKKCIENCACSHTGTSMWTWKLYETE